MDNKIRLTYLQEKLKFEKAKELKLVNGDFMSLDEFIQAGMYIPINEEQTYNSVLSINGGKGSGNHNPGRGWGPGKPGTIISESKLNDILSSTYGSNPFNEPGIESYRFKAIAKEIGYDGLPTKVSEEEYDLNPNEEVYRGVRDRKQDDGSILTDEQMIEQFYNGECYYGNGKYGPGIYTSKNEFTAKTYSNPHNSKVIVGKLSNDAKIINIRQEFETNKERKFREEYEKFRNTKSQEYLEKSQKAYKNGNNDLGMKYSNLAEDYASLDETVFAALKGYDAVCDDIGEYVILNRSKIIYK